LSSLTCKYRGIGEVKVQAQNRLTFAIRHTHTHKRPTAPKKASSVAESYQSRDCLSANRNVLKENSPGVATPRLMWVH